MSDQQSFEPALRERRKEIRVSARATARIDTDVASFRLETREMSIGGMRAFGEFNLQPDHRVKVVLGLDEGSATCEARVTWIKSNEAGFQFLNLEGYDRQLIGRFILGKMPWWKTLLPSS